MKHKIFFITGPMKSGKSKLLIEYINDMEARGLRVLALKAKQDKRDKSYIRSRGTFNLIKAFGICADDIPVFGADYLETVDIIIVDEVQFLDLVSYKHIIQMAKAYNKPLILAGLTYNFKLEVFDIILKLFKEEVVSVITLTADCDLCKNKATNSVRVIDNKVVWSGDDIDCHAKYITICDECLNKIIKIERGC